MRLLVTGGAGFIGSAVIRQTIAETDHVVVNVDALTYAGDLRRLGSAGASPRHHFVHLDICDGLGLHAVLDAHRPDAVMHLAAESHVDRSIAAPAAFIQTNVVGTSVLLDQVLGYWQALAPVARDRFRFLHVSTDEVYGSIDPPARANDDCSYQPNSPYAASKAASDHLARAWHRTWGLPVVTSHGSNTYGPHQHVEKLIPRMIARAAAGQPMPVYGSGENVREWLHVEDHARALRLLVDRGVPGRSYNVGTGDERANIDVVRQIAAVLDELRPAAAPHARFITSVADRLGHDRRYAMDADRIRTELGWTPNVAFNEGLRETVRLTLAQQAEAR